MENKSFTATIEVSKSPQDVFNRITNDVAKWWGGKDLEGSSKKLNDEFIIHHPGAHYSKQKLVEVVPGKKITWLVTDSTLHWLKRDQREWTNTKMVFEITTEGDKTLLHFTHEGLVPEKECYAMCEKGWTMVIKDWLFHFISNGEIKIESYQGGNEKKHFNSSIAAKISASEAIKLISNIPGWWGVTFSGSSEKQNDTFTIKMGGESFFNFSVVELIPGKRIVWLVTDCNMPWYADKKEWANSKLIFELTENNGLTDISFMHEGLTPEVECYKDCAPGWTHWIKTSLFSYLTTGKGVFREPSI